MPQMLMNLMKLAILCQGRSESKNLLYVPACRTATYGNRLFTVETATFWNDLPQEVRDAANLSSIKRLLKTHFFKFCLSSKLSFSMSLVHFNVFLNSLCMSLSQYHCSAP